MAIGINDVAQAAGVSTTTVSRALRGVGSISPATVQRVRDVAATLGYAPLASAVALAAGRTHAVGLLAPSVSRWFYATVIEGAEATLRASGYDGLLHLLNTPVGSQRIRLNADVLRGRVDAVIVAGLALEPDEVAALGRLGVPVVSVSVRHDGVTFVGIDDAVAERALTRRVIELGHQRIAHIGGPTIDDNASSTAVKRREAWLETMADAGLPVPPEYDQPGDFTLSGGWGAAHRLLDMAPDVTAVLVDSDEMATGVLQAFHERGVRPGADVSVVGFDGHSVCAVLGLATVEQPTYAQGHRAAELILGALRGQELPSEVVFATRIVERPSLRERADAREIVTET